jgi:hypothetical protein
VDQQVEAQARVQFQQITLKIFPIAGAPVSTRESRDRPTNDYAQDDCADFRQSSSRNGLSFDVRIYKRRGGY